MLNVIGFMEVSTYEYMRCNLEILNVFIISFSTK